MAVRIWVMMNRIWRYVFLVIVVGVLGTGCGYTTRSTLPTEYRTVAVPAFRSEIREPDLQPVVTNAVRRRIELDGRLGLAGRADADLVLRGTLKKYEVNSLSQLRDDEPSQVLVKVSADVVVEDRRTGEIRWRAANVVGSSRYFRRGVASRGLSRGTTGYFAGDLTSFPSPEQGQSTAEAIDDLATEILYRLLEY